MMKRRSICDTYNDGGRCIRHRPVHHVGMASDPADVGGTPEGVFFAVVEHIAESSCSIHHITGRRMHHTLRFASRPANIQIYNIIVLNKKKDPFTKIILAVLLYLVYSKNRGSFGDIHSGGQMFD